MHYHPGGQNLFCPFLLKNFFGIDIHVRTSLKEREKKMGKFSSDAKKLLDYVGGKENIKAVTHCANKNAFFVLVDPLLRQMLIRLNRWTAKGTFTQSGQFPSYYRQ